MLPKAFGAALVLAYAITTAQSPDVVFRGATVSSEQLVALSLPAGTPAAAIDAAVARLGPQPLVLVYQDYQGVIRTFPVAIYQQGKKTQPNSEAAGGGTGATIGDMISRATTTGVRTGATCRDGSHSNATGSGACSNHGGVAQWLISSARDPNAVIATICSNYLLKSGSGCPSSTKVLALILNRPY